MDTKYNIGDILIVRSYTEETFVSSVTKIVMDVDSVMYELDYLDKSGNAVKVPEIESDGFFYNIVRKVGNLDDSSTKETRTIPKKFYPVDQQFLVTYAYHSRTESYQTFQLIKVSNITLGLHDTLEQAKDQMLSDGEVACALSNSLHTIFDDETYKDSYTVLVNWWPI